MTKLDLNLDAKFIEGVKSIAERHYGDGGDAALGRVVEAALELRLLWGELAGQGGPEVNEPVANWEFKSGPSDERIQSEIRRELFRGGE